MPCDDLQHLPGHLIRRAQQIAVSIFIDEAGDIDITPMQYSVLAVLRATPGVDQITLAHRAALDRSTIGGLAERLEDKGWIRRVTSEEDRRQKLLWVTDEGLAILDRMAPIVQRTQERILAPLTPREADRFMALLGKVVDANNEISRAPFKVGA